MPLCFWEGGRGKIYTSDEMVRLIYIYTLVSMHLILVLVSP